MYFYAFLRLKRSSLIMLSSSRHLISVLIGTSKWLRKAFQVFVLLFVFLWTFNSIISSIRLGGIVLVFIMNDKWRYLGGTSFGFLLNEIVQVYINRHFVQVIFSDLQVRLVNLCALSSIRTLCLGASPVVFIQLGESLLKLGWGIR